MRRSCAPRRRSCGLARAPRRGGDAERRRLERDLHDGAQSRFAASRSIFGAPSASASGQRHRADPRQRDRQALRRLDELRELARGIHPAVLTDRGLDAALRRSPRARRCRSTSSARSGGACTARSRSPPTSPSPRRSPTLSSTPAPALVARRVRRATGSRRRPRRRARRRVGRRRLRPARHRRPRRGARRAPLGRQPGRRRHARARRDPVRRAVRAMSSATSRRPTCNQRAAVPATPPIFSRADPCADVPGCATAYAASRPRATRSRSSATWAPSCARTRSRSTRWRASSSRRGGWAARCACAIPRGAGRAARPRRARESTRRGGSAARTAGTGAVSRKS